MAKFIVHSQRLSDALIAAGIIGKDEADYVRRVVIDMEIGRAAFVYVERFADDQMIDVMLRGGLEVVEAPA